MNSTWIALRSIPPGGRMFVLTDQSIWTAPAKEFGLACRILEPLTAEVFVLPQSEGVLFRGRLTGKVALPCDRCSDDSLVDINHSFAAFEPLPTEALPVQAAASKEARRRGGREDATPLEGFADDGVDEAIIRLAAHGKDVEINPSALAWEEFSLALPVKPLCAETCKGLCPVCGKNRNTEPCACEQSDGDPRLAALRGLTVRKK